MKFQSLSKTYVKHLDVHSLKTCIIIVWHQSLSILEGDQCDAVKRQSGAVLYALCVCLRLSVSPEDYPCSNLFLLKDLSK